MTALNGIYVSFINVNGLFFENKIRIPQVGSANVKGFLCLADTRISLTQHAKISHIHNKSDCIGSHKQRFFGTASDPLNPHRSGGCAILFGKGYLHSCEEVVYDESNQRRFVVVLAKLSNGSRALICCFYLHAASSERRNKIALIKQLKKLLFELQCKHNPDFSILACDANITLDTPERDPTCNTELLSLLNMLQLKDAFRTLKPNLPGHTFFPPKVLNKPSRLDYLFISESCILRSNNPKIQLIPTCESLSDHLGLCLSTSRLVFSKLEKEKMSRVTWKFKDHVLLNNSYTSSLEALIKSFLISVSPCNKINGGYMTQHSLNKIKMSSIDEIFHHDDPSFPWTTHFYSLLGLIHDHQNDFCLREFRRINSKKIEINRKLSLLKGFCKLDRKQRRLLAVLQNNSDCLAQEELREKSYNLNINYEILGETASRWLLRKHVTRRGNSFIQELLIGDSMSNDIYAIEDSAKEHFERVYNAKDCHRMGDLVMFMKEEHCLLRKISDNTRSKLEKEYSLLEIMMIFAKVKKNKAGGLDGVTSRLFHFLCALIPKFIACGIKHEILMGKCCDNKVMVKKLVLIQKSGSNKKDIKRFRPISLYNILLKCATLTISARLKYALNKHFILPNFFTAYKKALSCSDTIMNVLCMIENAQKHDGNLCILNTDLSSAFDSLSRGLVSEIMCAANFPPFFIDSIRKVQLGAQVHIMSTPLSPMSTPVPQTSGFSQGDSLSGDMFNLGLLPLIIVLNHRKGIKRYKLLWEKNETFAEADSLPIGSTFTYSDDCVAMLSSEDAYQSVFTTLDLVKDFSKISALQLSLGKTSVCFPGGLPNEATIDRFVEYGLERSNLGLYFSFLGFDFDCSDLHEGVRKMIIAKTERIKIIFNTYDQNKSLTLAGRRLIANSLCLSTFAYILQPAFSINQTCLNTAQKYINSFVLAKKICLIDQSYLPCKKGGLGTPILYHKYLTAKISLLHKAVKQERNYERNQSNAPQAWVLHLMLLLRKMRISKINHVLHTGVADISAVIRFLRLCGAHLFVEMFTCWRTCLQLVNNDSTWVGSGLNAKCLKKSLKWKRKKRGKFAAQPRHDPIRRNFQAQDQASDRRPLQSHNTRPPEVTNIQANSLINNKKSMSVWPNICILGSPLYPDLNAMANWRREQFLICPPDGSLTIRNQKLSGIIDNGICFLGTFCDQDLLLTSKDHINLFRRQHEKFTLSSKRLRCFQIGALQIILELSQHFSLKTGNECRIKTDRLRDCMNSAKFNSGSCYSWITVCRFGSKQFSAIEKFARRGLSVTREMIIAAMTRCQDAIGSHRSLKCSTEICLGAMRSEYHLAAFDDRPRSPCYICNHPETVSHIYKHLLTDCAPAIYIWGQAYKMCMIATQARVSITDELIFFGQLQMGEYKKLSKINRRDILSIVACCRLTLWDIYYRRTFITRRMLLQILNKNIFLMKKTAKYRGVKTNLKKIRPIIQDFTNISYGSLVFRQREKTQRLLSSIVTQRAMADNHWNNAVSNSTLSQTVSYPGGDILRDEFYQTHNIFNKGGFATNARALAGVIQQGITNINAAEPTFLHTLNPSDAWF